MLTLDRTAYDRFFELEQKHFWRIAKRRLVLDWLSRYGPAPGGLRILDIGGAASLIPKELERWGTVLVVEADADTARFAHEQLGLDARPGVFPTNLPSTGPFDIITMCDVLEHIEDDSASLRAACDLLKPGGLLLCTVPALPWLWSDHDRILRHFRRYTRQALRERIEKAGFSMVRVSYYTSLLLPVIALQRSAGRIRAALTGRPKTSYDVKPPLGVLNPLFGAIMSLERQLLAGMDCWLGSSLIAVARRPARPASG